MVVESKKTQPPEIKDIEMKLTTISDSFVLATEFASLEPTKRIDKILGLIRVSLAKATIVLPLEFYRVIFRDLHGSLKTWWHDEVSRPKKNVDNTGLIQEKIGDPKLNGLEGEYLFQHEVNLSLQQAIYFALSQLKAMIMKRQWLEVIEGKMAAVPIGYKQNYVLEIRILHGYKKININGTQLIKLGLDTYVNTLISELQANAWNPLQDISSSQDHIRTGRNGILKCQNVNTKNPGSADMILNFVSSANPQAENQDTSQLLLDHSQDVLLSTNGANTPISHTFVVTKDGRVSDIQSKLFHPITDGSPGNIEICNALNSAKIQKRLERDSQDVIETLSPLNINSAPDVEGKRIVRARVDVTQIYDFITQHYDTFKNFKVAERNTTSSSELTPELPTYQLFVYALLLTLGRSSCHQLIGRAKDDSVIPNIVVLPKSLQDVILSRNWDTLK